MRLNPWLLDRPQAALVLLLVVAVAGRMMPLGVPGEWEWLRVRAAPLRRGAGAGRGRRGGLRRVRRAGNAVAREDAVARDRGGVGAGLAIAAAAVQVAVPTGAAPGYDLAKWAAVNYLPGSTGYFQIAREQAAGDPWRFLAEYPQWIRRQDSLHIGTHPPGLIVAQCVLLSMMERHPALAARLLNHMPATVEAGFRAFGGNDPHPLSRSRAGGALRDFASDAAACAATVVPLYLLARVALPAPAAWAAAALWPLAPAANLFQPVADTAYPFLSTSALALAAWATRGDGTRSATARAMARGMLAAVASGVVMMAGHGLHAGVPGRRTDRRAASSVRARRSPGGLARL